MGQTSSHFVSSIASETMSTCTWLLKFHMRAYGFRHAAIEQSTAVVQQRELILSDRSWIERPIRVENMERHRSKAIGHKHTGSDSVVCLFHNTDVG